MENIFFDIGLIIVIATLFAYLSKLIRQPLIPAYILTGLILGPWLGWITNSETIKMLSEIGISFLLFIVGLEISFERLKSVALISSLGGSIQIILLFAAGSFLAILLGFVNHEALYIGLFLAFSSTMIVVKLLSDKKELDTLHARIIIGILLMEDFFAILALSMLSSSSLSVSTVLLSIEKIVVLIFISFVASRYILPDMFKFAAKSQELLFLLSLTTSFGFALFASAMGISIIIGSFIAGITLANLPYNIEIIGKIKPLKDFFSTIFFVSLGMIFVPASIKGILFPVLIFILFIIIFKPFLIMVLCSFFGYKKRPSFLTSISLTQISEFSLIIAAQGLLLGHISESIVLIATILAVFTMTTTAYFINFDENLYRFFSKYLAVFEKLSKYKHEIDYCPGSLKKEVILCGYNRIGYSVLKTLKNMKKSFMVIDYNPEAIRYLAKEKICCIYGDIGDMEVLERVDLKKTKMVISTIPDKKDNLLLIKKLKEANKKSIIFVTANQIEEALLYYDEGADYVIMPHFLGGDHISLLIENFTGDINTILKKKFDHIEELKARFLRGHEHPLHD